jgi:hypothetical protein
MHGNVACGKRQKGPEIRQEKGELSIYVLPVLVTNTV